MRFALVCALAPLALLWPAPALAQAPTLAVSVGFDDLGFTGSWTPVTVTSRPDRPFQGELRIHSVDTSSGTTTTTVVPVDLTAGAPVAIRQVAPPGRVSVSLHDGEEQVASTRSNGEADLTQTRVGVLGAAQPSGPPVNLLPANRTTRWVAVDPAWLDVPHGLDTLDVLLVAPDQWQGLDADARRTLGREVALGGMTLVLTGEPDEQVLDLPLSVDAPGAEAITITEGEGDAVRTVATITPKGLGRVAMTDGDPVTLTSTVAWEAVVTPRAGVPDARDSDSYHAQPWAAQELLSASGDVPEVPAIPFLAVFLLVYLLVVGPLNALVLRRMGRPELAWATVPLLSLLFAIGPVVVSGGTTAQVPVSSQTLTWWLDGAGEERVAAAWLAFDSGTQAVRFSGEEWAAAPWGGQLSDARIAREGGGVVARAAARNGEVMGALATRPVDEAPPLDVDARLVDGRIEVTIHNASSTPVARTQLLIGNRVRDIDPVGPDETVTIVDDGALQGLMPELRGFPVGDQHGFGGGGLVEVQVEQAQAFPIEGGSDFPIEAMTEFVDPPFVDAPFFNGQGLQLFPASVRLGTPGLVWVVGRVEPDDPEWAVDGAVDGPAAAIVAIGSRVRVDGPVSVMPPAAVLTQGVDTNQFGGVHPVWVPELIGNGLTRIRLPELTDDARLAGFLQSFGPVELWDESARTWRNVPRSFTDVAAAPILTPGHEVFIRMSGDAMGSGIAVSPPGVAAGPAPENAMVIGELEPQRGVMTPMPVPLPLPQPSFGPTPVPSPTQSGGQ